MKLRLMKVSVKDLYTPSIWITAFDLQRRWKIEGVRFSADEEIYVEDSHYSDDPGSPYFVDEWYEDEYDDYEEDREIAGTSYDCQLYKAKNGHLVIVEIRGYCYWGQDWGETVGQWETEYIRLNQALPFYRKAAIHKGKTMKPGETIAFYAGDVRMVRPVRLLPAFRVMSRARVFSPDQIPF